MGGINTQFLPQYLPLMTAEEKCNKGVLMSIVLCQWLNGIKVLINGTLICAALIVVSLIFADLVHIQEN